MFNICRRGPASIGRIARLSSSLIQTTRPSVLLATKVPTTSIATRQFHISIANRLSAAVQEQANDIEEQKDAPQDEVSRFQELADRGLVSKRVIDEITKGMGHATMTDVQRMTINQTLKGTDIIAQARTGTGKTLGFLIPVVQSVLNDMPELEVPPKPLKRGGRGGMGRSSAKPSDIRAIIMSPTRELAEQIAVEAKKITRNTSIKVQVAVGGNSKTAMLREMQREGCHILVATPGRLYDLLSDEYSRVSAPNLTTFVLDEADRLLDDGFSKDIEEIMTLLPDREVRDRQTLLFSATIPREVMGLVRTTLKRDFQFVETVKEGELATHEKIPQNVTKVAGYENLMPALLELSKREMAKYENKEEGAKPFKAIVYHTSTANVILNARIFDNLKSDEGRFARHPLHPAELFIIHGKLTQQARTRAADRFRRAKTGIMFSTDVTARGMDFPGVSHVVQVGLPPSKDQYIHRVGRTGRGHSTGEGWIILTDCEMREARNMLRGIPITPNDTLEVGKVDMTQDAQLPAETAETLKQVTEATKMIDAETKREAFMGMLGVNQRVNDKEAMMEALNQWTRYGWGMENPPQIPQGLMQRLGLGRSRRPSPVGGFGDRGGSSGGFGGGFGGRGRSSGGFGDRGGFSDRGRSSGGFGDRGRSSGGFGDRGGFSDRGRSSGGFGDRGRSSGGFGDRGRSSGGFGDRGGFSDRGGRNDRRY